MYVLCKLTPPLHAFSMPPDFVRGKRYKIIDTSSCGREVAIKASSTGPVYKCIPYDSCSNFIVVKNTSMRGSI